MSQPVQIRLQRVKFLLKFLFPCFRFRVELSKYLRKVCLNKGMLKCKTFMLTPSELTHTNRHVFLSHPTLALSSTQTFSFLYRGLHRPTQPLGHFLSTDTANAFFLIHKDSCEDILRLLTFPVHLGITPLHKYIGRLLNFPTLSGLTPVHKDI